MIKNYKRIKQKPILTVFIDSQENGKMYKEQAK